jgi:hypothetical protein
MKVGVLPGGRWEMRVRGFRNNAVGTVAITQVIMGKLGGGAGNCW